MPARLSLAAAQRAMAIIGMVIALFCIHNQLLYPATFTFGGSTISVTYPFNLIYSGLTLILAVVLFFLHERTGRRVVQNGVALLVTGIAGAVGVGVVSQFTFTNTLTTVVVGAGIALIAIFVLHHFVFWVTRIAACSGDEGISDALIAFAVAYLLVAVASAFHIDSILTVIIPALLSGVLAYLSLNAENAPALPTEEMKIKVNLSLLIASVFFIYLGTLLIEFYNVTSQGSSPSARYLLYVADTLVCLVAIAVYLLRGRERRHSSFLVIFALYAVSLAAAIIIACVISADTASFGQFALVAGKNLFEGFVWLIIIGQACNTKSDPVRCVSLVFAVAIALPHAFSAFTKMTGSIPTLANDSLLTSFCIAGIGALVVCAITVGVFLVYLSRAVAEAAQAVKAQQEALEQAQSSQDPAQAQVDKATEAWKLSNREGEIAAYAYRNYSAQRIADELFISPGTVNTHLKSIYRKADVHSRHELIKAIEAFD